MRSSYAGHPRRDAGSDGCASSSSHRPCRFLRRHAVRVRVTQGIDRAGRDFWSCGSFPQPDAIRAKCGRSPKGHAHASNTCGGALKARLKPHAPWWAPNWLRCHARVDRALGNERIRGASQTRPSLAYYVCNSRSRHAKWERRLFRWYHPALPWSPMSKRTVRCGSRCAWHRAPRAPSRWVLALPGWQQ